MPKNVQTIALISHASKVMLKILQARLQQYVNHELPDVQAGFRKGRETRDQIGKFRWIIKEVDVFLELFHFFDDPAKFANLVSFPCSLLFNRLRGFKKESTNSSILLPSENLTGKATVTQES